MMNSMAAHHDETLNAYRSKRKEGIEIIKPNKTYTDLYQVLHLFLVCNTSVRASPSINMPSYQTSK